MCLTDGTVSPEAGKLAENHDYQGCVASTPFLSVVIPTFDEEGRIGTTLDAVLDYLGKQSYAWEVLVVDDGSFDNTVAFAEAVADGDRRVKVERLKHEGKGSAVKHGMLAAIGEYRFMCDADLAMPIQQLDSFVDCIGDGYDIVIGSRQVVGAKRYGEPFSRHVMGRVFNYCVRLLAVQGFEDTQCGFKCFKGSVADELFCLQRTKGFAFDVEILYLAARKGLKVIEIPIDWHHQESSKVKPYVDSLVMLKDTMLVKLRGVNLGRL